MFHIIEARGAGILSKIGLKVCVGLCGSVAESLLLNYIWLCERACRAVAFAEAGGSVVKKV